jgi:uncharacterized membrane protein
MNQPPDQPAPPAASPPPPPGFIERLISNLLRIVVVSSLLVVFVGETLSFAHHHDYLTHPPALQRLTTPGAAFPNTIEKVVSSAARGQGQAVVLIGLLLLIATPVMRVAVSILGFAHQRDLRYVLITSVVLALLILSFFLGAIEG